MRSVRLKYKTRRPLSEHSYDQKKSRLIFCHVWHSMGALVLFTVSDHMHLAYEKGV